MEKRRRRTQPNTIAGQALIAAAARALRAHRARALGLRTRVP